jgi:hypothetical protein
MLLLILLQVTKERMPTQKHAIAKNAKDNPKKAASGSEKKHCIFHQNTAKCKKDNPPPPPAPPKKHSFNLRKTRLYLGSQHANAKYKKYNTERASGSERDCYLLIKTCKCNIVLVLVLVLVVVPHEPPPHHHHHPSPSSSSFSATKKQHHQKQQQQQ